MRHLHFHAYDKVKKKWLWPYPDPFHIIGEITVFDLLKQQQIRVEDYNNIVIVQGTGEKDIKDKEIFEGHIVKNINGDLRQIIYYRNAFEMRLMNGNCDHNNTSWWFKVEIIGHIFDNPELLKK